MEMRRVCMDLSNSVGCSEKAKFPKSRSAPLIFSNIINLTVLTLLDKNQTDNITADL